MEYLLLFVRLEQGSAYSTSDIHEQETFSATSDSEAAEKARCVLEKKRYYGNKRTVTKIQLLRIAKRVRMPSKY